MERKIFFRVAAGLVTLAAFSLSCKLLDQVSEARSLSTQAQAVATELNVQATSLEGLATDINMEGVATSMQGLATQIDVEGLLTAMPAIDVGGIITDITGISGTESAATPAGFPADIPLLSAGLSDVTGSPTQIEYLAEGGVKDAVDFYRREMTARGWTEAPGSQVSDTNASLAFHNGPRTARISIEEDFISGVAIKIDLL